MHLFRELYFCLCSEKCMHKCNSLLTGFVIPLRMLLFIAIFFIYMMYFILSLINRTNPRGVLLCNYWWKSRKCWLCASALHITSNFKRGNQILCCLQNWWKYKVKCCCFSFWSHTQVPAWIQSLRSQHGIQRRFNFGSWLADKCTTQQSLTVFKTKTSDFGPTISTLPLLSVGGSWTWRGFYEIQTKKLFDGLPWVKRDKLAFKNFHLSLLCKKCISDQDKSTPLMVIIKKHVLSSSLSFSYEEKCITVEKQREESRRLGHPVLAHCQFCH